MRKLRILAVDDDPETLSLFKEIARETGITCDTASSGEEALELASHGGAYDICFTDWKLPGIDGIELAGRLKRGAANSRDLTIIVFSAAMLNPSEHGENGACVDKYLSKPLFPFTIIEVISDCIGVYDNQEKEAGQESRPLFVGRRVLLVEDVEINREIVLALLMPTRLEIDCAKNGKEAVAMFSGAPGKYDMILMDLQMPEMDGYQATQKIRALDARNAKTIPIVAMTANTFKDDIERCLSAGMNGHIGKPLDFDEVLKQIQAFLK
jgi:CheY-like chemotaxis protein